MMSRDHQHKHSQYLSRGEVAATTRSNLHVDYSQSDPTAVTKSREITPADASLRPRCLFVCECVRTFGSVHSAGRNS